MCISDTFLDLYLVRLIINNKNHVKKLIAVEILLYLKKKWQLEEGKINILVSSEVNIARVSFNYPW